ncbi:predicted protein, partial [Naegleria gruberi]
EFYDGKTLLCTGCTGFIGKTLAEKILRCLPNVNKVYLLIRSKKKYALSKLIYALRLNVFGTLNMLRFALHCPNVQCFTHVSTAYVNSNQPSGSKIFERFYPLYLQNSTVGEKQKKHRIRKLVTGYTNTQEYTQDVHNKEDQNFMTQFTNTVLKNTKFPNTYTLTKHLAEKLVAKYHGRVPISIVRPTIVGAALKEPQPGWIDAVSAGAAVYLFIGLCVLRIIPGKYDSISDQIPVDFVVNTLLIAITTSKDGNERGLLRIYHSGTSTSNPAPWRTTATRVAEYWRKCPSKRKIDPSMSPNILMIDNPINYNTQFFLRYTAWSQLFKALDRLSYHYQNSVSMLNGNNDLLGNLIK